MTTELASLARFVRRARRAREESHCEVCGTSITTDHRHVVDRKDRRLLCACAACALAFDGDQPARFRSVPDRSAVRVERETSLGARELAALGVPVGLAFFFRPSSVGRVIAVFPSAAGPTEAELADGAWAALEERSALVRGIADDVEALLVRRTRDGRARCFVVPVDLCYELTAVLRRTWRGVDGGDEAREAIDAFFARLPDGEEGGAA